MSTRVFVYGTLQPGHSAYDVLCVPHLLKAQSAIVIGQLYHLPIGYPAIALKTNHNVAVHGMLLSFDRPAVLDGLDNYEQHDPEEMVQHYPDLDTTHMPYRRVITSVYTCDRHPLGSAWIYTMKLKHIHALHGIHLPTGKWQVSGNSQNHPLSMKS